MAAIFTTIFARLLFERHANFDTYAFDLGLLSQVTWNTLGGRLFETTIMPVNYLAEHLSPVLLLFSPILLVWPDVRALLFLQALAAGLTGFLLFLFGRQLLVSELAALAFELAFFIAPVTAWVTRDEFHPITLALPLVVLASLFLWRGRFWWAAFFAGLTLLTNEEMTIYAIPFGLLVAIWSKRKGGSLLPGLSLAVFSALWLSAYLWIVSPELRQEMTVSHPIYGAFSWCDKDTDSISKVAACLIRDPVATLRMATTPGDIEAALAILGPTAGLGLFGPTSLVGAAHGLVMLFGNDPPNFRAHYSALLIALSFVGAIETTRIVSRRAPARIGSLARTALPFVVLLASLTGYFTLSPLPGGGLDRSMSEERRERVELLTEAFDLVPQSAGLSITSTSSFLPHFALRDKIYLLSEGKERFTDYRIYDLKDPYPTSREELERLIVDVRADPCYQPIFDRAEVVVFVRECQKPEIVLSGTFGGMIRLQGYSFVDQAGAGGSDQAPAGKLRVALFWSVEAPADADYHFFAHLIDESGDVFSQQDGQLAGGALPLTRLTRGERIREWVTVDSPPLREPGKYWLEVGWYDSKSGKRLLLTEESKAEGISVVVGDNHPDKIVIPIPGQ